jgi:hypothetical protein
MFDPDGDVSPEMKALLSDLAPYVVVVGSVARGKTFPKDLDLICGETDAAYERIRAIVRKHAIPFESFWPGNWCFLDNDQMIEILPFHEGRSYRACRRAGRKRMICGVELVVAAAKYAPAIP